MVRVNTCQHLNSFFQGIQLTWLNAAVAKTAGQGSEFATKTLQYTPPLEGGTSLPKPECTGCHQSSQAAGKKPQTPDTKMLIS